MTPEEGKAVHWCTVHGAEWCGLGEQAREAWERMEDGSTESKLLLLTASVDRNEPEHGAVYSRAVSLEEAKRDLNRQVGAMKAARTRKAKNRERSR